MDKGFIEYQLISIREHEEWPYQMSNGTLIDELFPYVKEIYPDAKLVKFDIMQWIVVSEKGQEVVLRQLRAMKAQREQAIRKIEQAINELNFKEDLRKCQFQRV